MPVTRAAFRMEICRKFLNRLDIPLICSSDMKNLIQEACQGPIRDAVRSAGAKVASLQEEDLRPVVIRDFAMAAKAQRASTEPSEITRYEIYNEKHGAKIVDDEAEQDQNNEDLWD